MEKQMKQDDRIIFGPNEFGPVLCHVIWMLVKNDPV